MVILSKDEQIMAYATKLQNYYVSEQHLRNPPSNKLLKLN